MAKPLKVTPDELRRAFTIVYLAPDIGDDPDADSPALQALEAQFPPEKVDALFARVMLVLLWLATEGDGPLVGEGASLLGVPEIHPAIFDVAATHPMPSVGVPNPDPFMRALEKRVQSYNILLN